MSRFYSGDKVILDKGYANESVVTVVRALGRRGIITIIEADGQRWEVMSYRLTLVSKAIKTPAKFLQRGTYVYETHYFFKFLKNSS